MLIPAFALRRREKDLLAHHLNRAISITLQEKVTAYVVDDQAFKEVCSFVEEYRYMNEELTGPKRSGVIRGVATIFNVMVDVNKIKDPDQRAAANASLLAAVMGIYNISPEYGDRLLSILKSKI